MSEQLSSPLSTLLVIDDDAALLYSICKSLSSPELKIFSAGTAQEGLSLFRDQQPDAVLLDLRLAEASGLDVLREIRSCDPQAPVIVFTAFSTMTMTIEATKSGAFDYLLKPVNLENLREAVERALEARRANQKNSKNLSAEAFRPGSGVTIIGTSAAMQEVYKQIGRFAGSNGNILVLGESGTGKELVARAIHQHSSRCNEQFVAINCAALSETLLESELFGHERGAFTGADRRRLGKFEHASGGTLFLDEVADMSQTTQAKVLRLLQEQRFERLGGNQTISTDVRIVAATNKNLISLVEQGLFREDLYYRLNVFSIRLPPLRDRLEDLPELLSYFVSIYREEFGKEQVHIEGEAMRLLQRYSWPGNMRELQSVCKYALAHAVGGLLRSEHLPPHVFSSAVRSGGRKEEILPLRELTLQLLKRGERDIYERASSLLDHIVLPLVLDHTGGNMQQACELLGISRNTLKAKMRQQNIKVAHAILSKSDLDHQILR